MEGRKGGRELGVDERLPRPCGQLAFDAVESRLRVLREFKSAPLEGVQPGLECLLPLRSMLQLLREVVVLSTHVLLELLDFLHDNVQVLQHDLDVNLTLQQPALKLVVLLMHGVDDAETAMDLVEHTLILAGLARAVGLALRRAWA